MRWASAPAQMLQRRMRRARLDNGVRLVTNGADAKDTSQLLGQLLSRAMDGKVVGAIVISMCRRSEGSRRYELSLGGLASSKSHARRRRYERVHGAHPGARAAGSRDTVNYHDFKAALITCKHCNWQGLGVDMEVGEAFEGGQISEYHCPKCGEYWGAISWPAVGENQGRIRALWPAHRECAAQHATEAERKRYDLSMTGAAETNPTLALGARSACQLLLKELAQQEAGLL